MKIAQQVSSDYYKVTLPPEIAAEYGQLKWEIKVGKKPRGMWRPKFILKFGNTVTENKLNINEHFSFLFFLDEEGKQLVKKCNSCQLCKEKLEKLNSFFPKGVGFFKNSAHGSTDKLKMCFFRNCVDLFSESENFSWFLEWRPGKPDYSDVIEWFAKNWCIPVVEEYNRRILEAYESEPLEEEAVFSSDDLEFQARQEKIKKETEKKPSRKLRVA